MPIGDVNLSSFDDSLLDHDVDKPQPKTKCKWINWTLLLLTLVIGVILGVYGSDTIIGLLFSEKTAPPETSSCTPPLYSKLFYDTVRRGVDQELVKQDPAWSLVDSTKLEEDNVAWDIYKKDTGGQSFEVISYSRMTGIPPDVVLDCYRNPKVRKRWDTYTKTRYEIESGEVADGKTRFVNGSIENPAIVYKVTTTPVPVMPKTDAVLYRASETIVDEKGNKHFTLCVRQAEGRSAALMALDENLKRVYIGITCSTIFADGDDTVVYLYTMAELPFKVPDWVLNTIMSSQVPKSIKNMKLVMDVWKNERNPDSPSPFSVKSDKILKNLADLDDRTAEDSYEQCKSSKGASAKGVQAAPTKASIFERLADAVNVDKVKLLASKNLLETSVDYEANILDSDDLVADKQSIRPKPSVPVNQSKKYSMVEQKSPVKRLKKVELMTTSKNHVNEPVVTTENPTTNTASTAQATDEPVVTTEKPTTNTASTAQATENVATTIKDAANKVDQIGISPNPICTPYIERKTFIGSVQAMLTAQNLYRGTPASQGYELIDRIANDKLDCHLYMKFTDEYMQLITNVTYKNTKVEAALDVIMLPSLNYKWNSVLRNITTIHDGSYGSLFPGTRESPHVRHEVNEIMRSLKDKVNVIASERIDFGEHKIFTVCNRGVEKGLSEKLKPLIEDVDRGYGGFGCVSVMQQGKDAVVYTQGNILRPKVMGFKVPGWTLTGKFTSFNAKATDKYWEACQERARHWPSERPSVFETMAGESMDSFRDDAEDAKRTAAYEKCLGAL